MPPQSRPTTNTNVKPSVTLSYTTLLSLLSALLTLKLYHAISTLTHGRKPVPATIQAIERRIATCFLRIIPQSKAYPSTPVVGVDGAITDADTILFPFQDRESMAHPYLHSLPAPGIYSQKARTGIRARTGTGTATWASTNSNTNSNSYGHPTINPNTNLNANPSSKSTQIFHFSAFDLPSNQTRRGESSFVQTLATCAPYQRVGLRLVPGGGSHTVSSSAGAGGNARLDPDVDEDGVFECMPASVSASISECTPVSENTPKVTITDTDTDLEACLYDPGMVRLANSFPGESPTFCAVRDDSSVGGPGGRGKAVYSVRPFSDLD